MNRIEQLFRNHPRLFCWLFALLGVGLTAYEWYEYRHETFYRPTAAVLGPLCAILFGAFGMLPRQAAQEKRKKVLQAIALLGLIAGFFNWYAMTHF